MAERRSALTRSAAHAGDDARIVVGEEHPFAILQVRAWPERLAAVEAQLAEMLTLFETLPPGRAVDGVGGTLCALGAGRFLLAAANEDAAEAWRMAFQPADAAMTDISHGRTVISVTGESAAELMARCAPLDFDSGAFPPGRVAETAIHHIDVLIRRRGEAHFEVWALRSFAESLVEWLLDAGAELGARFAGS